MVHINIPPIEYRPGELTRATLARGGDGWNFHQGPSFHRFSDGRLLCHWGVYDVQECSNDGAVVYSVSNDAGESWSEPVLFMKAPNAVISHASLLEVEGSDRVIMAYTEGHYVGAREDPRFKRVTKWADYGSTTLRVFLRESTDSGVSWGAPREIDPALIVGRDAPPFYGAPYQLLQLAGGAILLSVPYLHPDRRNPQHFHVAVLRSIDRGATWQKIHDFTVPEQRGAMEPCMVELDGGEIYCVMRNKSGYLYEMRSSNAGASWDGPKKTDLPTPESMPKMIRLSSGRLLLVWNNISSTEQRPRYPLVAAVSADGGATWSGPRLLADELGRNQLSNHDIIQLPDGRILAGVSHYRAQRPACSDIDLYVFDEQWLNHGEE